MHVAAINGIASANCGKLLPMATRKYRRDSNGRFAGSSGGTMTTTGRAGGFANARVRQQKATNAERAARRARRTKNMKVVAGVAASVAAQAAVRKLGQRTFQNKQAAKRRADSAAVLSAINRVGKSIT